MLTPRTETTFLAAISDNMFVRMFVRSVRGDKDLRIYVVLADMRYVLS